MVACAALAAGEYAASFVPWMAEGWPVMAGFAVLVAVAGYGFAWRGWHLLFLFAFGAAIFLLASVESEHRFRLQPWMRKAHVQRRESAFAAAKARRSSAVAPIRRELSRRVAIGLEGERDIVALNRAILLGERERLPAQMRRTFVESGAIHVFAISGLHVMMVAGLIKRLLQKFVPSSRAVWAICIVAAPCYAVLAGMSPSAVRAAAMAVLWMAAPLFGRRPNSLAAFSVTAIGVYALRPERMFDVGCSLSFTVIFGILVCSRWAKCNGFGFGRLAVSTAAWAAGVPIAAHAFGRLAVGSLVANAAVVVAAGTAVALGFMGIAAGFVSPVLAAFFNGQMAAIVWAMAWVSDALAGISWLSMSVRPWTALECAAWYGFWILAMMLAEKVFLKSFANRNPSVGGRMSARTFWYTTRHDACKPC